MCSGEGAARFEAFWRTPTPALAGLVIFGFSFWGKAAKTGVQGPGCEALRRSGADCGRGCGRHPGSAGSTRGSSGRHPGGLANGAEEGRESGAVKAGCLWSILRRIFTRK